MPALALMYSKYCFFAAFHVQIGVDPSTLTTVMRQSGLSNLDCKTMPFSDAVVKAKQEKEHKKREEFKTKVKTQRYSPMTLHIKLFEQDLEVIIILCP